MRGPGGYRSGTAENTSERSYAQPAPSVYFLCNDHGETEVRWNPGHSEIWGSPPHSESHISK
jgi:hypothetical protein